MADQKHIDSNADRPEPVPESVQENPARKEELLLLVRQALEQEHISLGRAAEIPGFHREDMRKYARENGWGR